MTNNNVIIFSYSKIAQQIAKVLREKQYNILIIEEDEKLFTQAKKDNFEAKQLSLMDDQNLIDIGIQNKNIKAFFCLSDDKNINLFVTLSVRNLNKDLKIISISFTKEDNDTILLAGANKVINPHEIGALRISRLLHKPLILNMLDNILFSESNIEVEEITIKEGSLFDGVFFKDINLASKFNLIVLGIQDKEISDKFIFHSSGQNHKIDHGDTLVVLGYSNDLRKFKKTL
ncbi:MAG: NAD-binding protein [Campylobacterota bacterium]|nr:NAD-binding protein [Campylobacterota bacterium]